MNPVGDLHDEEEFHNKPVNKKIIILYQGWDHY